MADLEQRYLLDGNGTGLGLAAPAFLDRRCRRAAATFLHRRSCRVAATFFHRRSRRSVLYWWGSTGIGGRAFHRRALGAGLDRREACAGSAQAHGTDVADVPAHVGISWRAS